MPDNISFFDPIQIENDLAQSAWNDAVFAVWFGRFAKRAVLYTQAIGEEYFKFCEEFSRRCKVPPAKANDSADIILPSKPLLQFFKSLNFKKMPDGSMCKPTVWQMDKAKRYLASRYNKLLSEKLKDAEDIRQTDSERADYIAEQARKDFTMFTDSAVTCNRAIENVDDILTLAEDNPPLFTLDGELGRMLNPRLKPDNLGIFLADPKVGKTTMLVSLAIASSKCVPTLLIGTGDESELKYNARIMTNLSFCASQPDFAGSFAVPIPDCQHNADGSCPVNLSGEPRITKDWKSLIESGATPEELCDGTFDGSLTISNKPYLPCCRCFPMGDANDAANRKNWKSAIWWKRVDVPLGNRSVYEKTLQTFRYQSFNGGLRIAAFNAGALSVDGIGELLDSIDRTDNFVPRVIVIDYADLMKQDMGRSTDKDLDGMRRIWEGLRALSSRLKLLVITATQTNRTSDEQETLTRRTIGRSAKAADNCTWMVSLNQTVTERRAKVMRCSMMYAREGRFDPEIQAMCCQWYEMQDAFAFSMPIFCKIKPPKEN